MEPSNRTPFSWCREIIFPFTANFDNSERCLLLQTNYHCSLPLSGTTWVRATLRAECSLFYKHNIRSMRAASQLSVSRKLGGTMIKVHTGLLISKSSSGCELLSVPLKAAVWSAVLKGPSTWQTGKPLWVTVGFSVCLWQRLSSFSALKLASEPIGNGSFIIYLP